MADGFNALRLIGDELLFEGELVAVLTTNASASLRGRFEDLLTFGEDEAEDTDCSCPPRLHYRDCECYKAEDGVPIEPEKLPAMIERAAAGIARGGLLRMSDLARVIVRMNKEEE